MIVIGIDPGIKGGIAFYRPYDKRLKVFDMPVMQRADGREQVNASQLTNMVSRFVKQKASSIAIVERVHAMTYIDRMGNRRGQGAKSSFNFGMSAGVVYGVLAAHWIRIIEVEPAVWKVLLSLSADKNLSMQKARDLFPRYASEFVGRKDGRAEAALLAWFGAERFLQA